MDDFQKNINELVDMTTDMEFDNFFFIVRKGENVSEIGGGDQVEILGRLELAKNTIIERLKVKQRKENGKFKFINNDGLN